MLPNERPSSRIQELLSLFARCEPDLHRDARSRIPRDVRAAVDVDDLMQSLRFAVFLQSNRPAFQFPRHFSGWAQCLGRGELTDAVRNARALKRGGRTAGRADGERPGPHELSQVIGPGRTPTAEAVHAESIRLLRGALDELAPSQRQALALHYWGDQTCQQISEQLQISVRAVKRLLRAGRAALRNSLEPPES